MAQILFPLGHGLRWDRDEVAMEQIKVDVLDFNLNTMHSRIYKKLHLFLLQHHPRQLRYHHHPFKLLWNSRSSHRCRSHFRCCDLNSSWQCCCISLKIKALDMAGGIPIILLSCVHCFFRRPCVLLLCLLLYYWAVFLLCCLWNLFDECLSPSIRWREVAQCTPETVS